MTRKIIPDVISTPVAHTLPAGVSVRRASEFMKNKGASAVMVVENKRLIGLFTERDLITRVITEGRDVDTTRLADVMTCEPQAISPDHKCRDAYRLMKDFEISHLPIVDSSETPVGLVSMRDLFISVMSELEEDVHDREELIFGSATGLA